MPFLAQPSQFILAWDRHQICWLAYQVARLIHVKPIVTAVGMCITVEETYFQMIEDHDVVVIKTVILGFGILWSDEVFLPR